MELTPPETGPPADADALVQDSLQEIIDTPGFAAEVLGEIEPGELSLVEPHGIYATPLEEVARGSVLEAAQLVAWRYLLLHGEDLIALVDVSPDGEELLGVSQGEILKMMADALESVAQLDGPASELRGLHLVGRSFTALWLHGPADVLLPMTTGTPLLEPDAPVDAAAVIAAVAPLAQAVLELPPHDDGPTQDRDPTQGGT